MSLVRANKLYKSYGEQLVLANLNFTLDRGQKIAVVGPNGTGKTTLLKLVAGVLEIDKGELALPKGTRVGYLPQDFMATGSETVADYLRRSGGTDSADHKWQAMLAGFGLDQTTYQQSLDTLSSGQRSKVTLAGILLAGADLLLLDEPTNNLDLPAMIWLEDFLLTSEAAVLIVSHDRRFLDRVVRKLFELDWETHGLKVSGGTYSDYLAMELKRLERRKLDYQQQQEEMERLTRAANAKREAAERGKRYKAPDNDKLAQGAKRDRAKKSARNAVVIERRVKRLDTLQDPNERLKLELPLQAEVTGGELDITLNKLVAGYQDGFSLSPVTLDLRYGTRIGIMGFNGAGKSTLIKTLTGELKPLSGTLTLGSGVRVGLMMQEHESLPRESTLLNFMKGKTSLEREDIYNLLIKFNFTEEQVGQRIETLSPGGRARLLLALFAATGVNTLVLDEPTNHLDIDAQAALEAMLATYTGTVILVSHDRYFIEHTHLDELYVVEDGGFKKLPDYQSYIAEAEKRAKKLLRLL